MPTKNRFINPTVLLWVVSWGGFMGSIALVAWFAPPAWVLAPLVCLQIVFLILLFTVVHDGVHRTVSETRWINETLTHSCWLPFMNSPYLFRKIHIFHHARTNDQNDPDHFTSAETLGGRWLKSFLLVFYYYHWSLKECRFGGLERVHTILSPLTSISIGVAALWTGRWDAFFWMWMVPAYVGTSLLAFLNTAWPHHPGKDRSRYGNTRILLVPRWLELLMGYQNLHLVHHLQPTIPWYEYPEYFRQNEADIVAKGGVILDYRPLI